MTEEMLRKTNQIIKSGASFYKNEKIFWKILKKDQGLFIVWSFDGNIYTQPIKL